MRYPLQQLQEEVAFLAYYFHWSYDQIMSLDHRERRQWVQHINQIHQRQGLAGSPYPVPPSAIA